jgi:hypothetical protein
MVLTANIYMKKEFDEVITMLKMEMKCANNSQLFKKLLQEKIQVIETGEEAMYENK